MTGRGGIPLRMAKPARAREPRHAAQELERLGVPVLGTLAATPTPTAATASGSTTHDGDRARLPHQPAGAAALAELVAPEGVACRRPTTCRTTRARVRAAPAVVHLRCDRGAVRGLRAARARPAAAGPARARDRAGSRSTATATCAMGCNILAVRPGVVVMVDGVPRRAARARARGRRGARLRRFRPVAQGRRRADLPDGAAAARLGGLEHHGDALADADAHRGQRRSGRRGARSSSASVVERAARRTRRAGGRARSRRRWVDARRRRRPSSRMHGERLRGERLVQLDQVDVGERRARPASSAFWVAGDRADAHDPRGRRRRPRPTTTRASGVSPSAAAPLAAATSTAAAPSLSPRGVAGRDGAAARNAGRSLAERLERRVAPRVLVGVDRDRLALAPGPSTGTISRVEAAGVDAPRPRAAGCAARTRPARSRLIAVLARRRSRPSRPSRSVPYSSAIRGLTKPPAERGVVDLARPRGNARSALGMHERRARHPLDAAGDERRRPRRPRSARAALAIASSPEPHSRLTVTPGTVDREARRAAPPSARRCGCPRRPGWRSRG